MAPFSEIAALRLGFGLSPLAPPPGDLAGVLASVDAATLPDGWTTRAAAKAQVALGDLRKALAAGEIDQDEFRAANHDLNNVRQDALRRRVARAVGAPAGFGERLVQFWSDHFTTVAQNPPDHPLAAAFVDEALRPHPFRRPGPAGGGNRKRPADRPAERIERTVFPGVDLGPDPGILR